MISTIEKVLFLKSVPLFSEIPGEQLSQLAEIAVEETFDNGKIFIRQGDMGDCMYLIVEGKVDILVGDKQVAQLGEKQSVGEMAILDSEPRSASVKANGEVTALRIDRDDFYDLLAEKVEVAQGVIKVLTQRLREANKKKAG
ncbi:MAG: hypothetical protein GMKNLPBB_00026 [Myxococcota bacterium]|nr:hypothetical protein [Myxococcota bacterium]